MRSLIKTGFGESNTGLPRVGCLADWSLDSLIARSYNINIRLSAKRIKKYAGILKPPSKAIFGFSDWNLNPALILLFYLR